MKRHDSITALLVTVVILLGSVASLAQQTLDRTKVPPLTKSSIERTHLDKDSTDQWSYADSLRASQPAVDLVHDYFGWWC